MSVKLLTTNRLVLTWLCAGDSGEKTSKLNRFGYVAVTSVLIVSALIAILASVAYFLKFVSFDLEKSMNALFPVVAGCGLEYTIFTAIILKDKLSGIFNDLDKIYNENVDPESRAILMEVNLKCEWIWKQYLIFAMSGFVVSTIVMSAASVAFCLINYGSFDTEYLFHGYRFILPWNQKDPLGYLLECFTDLLVGESYFFGNGSLLLLFVSICLFHVAFTKQFQNTISKLGAISGENPYVKRELLHELIRFHYSIKSWFYDSAEVYSPYILVLLISSTIFLALIVFQMDMQFRHVDFNIVLILTGCLVSLTNLFVYCYFGKVTTESYEDIAYCVYNSKWVEMPIDLQKYIVLILTNTQKPIYYHGFNVAHLNLETFTSLLRIVYQYYMMFKTATL